jgi:hypothetical protein
MKIDHERHAATSSPQLLQLPPGVHASISNA